jgi:hypothetical protein
MWSDPDFIEAVDRMEAAVAQAAAPEAVVAQAAHDSAPFWPLDKVRLTLAPRQADEDWFTKPADMVDFVFFRPCFRSDGVQRSAKLRMRINVTSLAGLNKAFRQRRLRSKPEANFIGHVAEICLLAPLQRQDKNSRNHWIYLVDANGQHRVTTQLFPADKDPFAFGQACPDIEFGDIRRKAGSLFPRAMLHCLVRQRNPESHPNWSVIPYLKRNRGATSAKKKYSITIHGLTLHWPLRILCRPIAVSRRQGAVCRSRREAGNQ